MRAPADGEWADDGGSGAPGAGGGAATEGGGFGIGAGGMAALGAFLSGGSFGGWVRGGARRDVTRGAAAAAEEVHYEATDERVLLGCSGSDFEVCVALDPMTDESTAVGVCNRLCTWLRQQESRLFVTQ